MMKGMIKNELEFVNRAFTISDNAWGYFKWYCGNFERVVF